MDVALTLLLPGQPVSIPRNLATHQPGLGLYLRDSHIRASLVGVPTQLATVRDHLLPLFVYLKYYFTYFVIIFYLCREQTVAISRVRPHPPASGSVVLGIITRLSPLQATLSITVVDGVPLSPGEEFTGVVRAQDIRAAEKDKVRMGDCFRGGDVVRGIVVRTTAFLESAALMLKQV